MSRLKDKYRNQVLPILKEEFGIKNAMAVPRLQKVVINIGVGEAKDNLAVMDRVLLHLANLSGQKAVVTRAKHSISNFKLSEGQSIGAMVTLRGERMYEFLDKLMAVVLPRVRDFRGVSERSFDRQGNYNLGIREQIIFPEIDYNSRAVLSSADKNIDKIRGLEVTIVTTSKDLPQGKRLLELLGMPFKKTKD